MENSNLAQTTRPNISLGSGLSATSPRQPNIVQTISAITTGQIFASAASTESGCPGTSPRCSQAKENRDQRECSHWIDINPVVKSVHGRPFRRPSDKRLWPTSRKCLIGSEIRDAFLKNVLISVSNIDQSVEVANAHARYITALHGICP
jgi:hypothetical protein